MSDDHNSHSSKQNYAIYKTQCTAQRHRRKTRNYCMSQLTDAHSPIRTFLMTATTTENAEF